MQKTDCFLNGFNANGFHVAAVGQLFILQMNLEVSTIVQSGYYRAIPRFDTHDEAT